MRGKTSAKSSFPPHSYELYAGNNVNTLPHTGEWFSCNTNLVSRIVLLFVDDLRTTPRYLSQLTSIKEKRLTHVQLLDKNRVLALHQGSGRIIEFPLVSVSRIYRISNTAMTGGTPRSTSSSGDEVSHIIILEFLERKLAFHFGDAVASQRFLVCMELLVRKAQEMYQS